MNVEHEGDAGTGPQRPSRSCDTLWPRQEPRSDVIELLEVAATAQQLDVVVRIAAASRVRNDVIEFQVLRCPALGALASVLLPDSLPDFSGDGSGHGRVDSLDDCLVCAADGDLEDCCCQFGLGSEVVDSISPAGRSKLHAFLETGHIPRSAAS